MIKHIFGKNQTHWLEFDGRVGKAVSFRNFAELVIDGKNVWAATAYYPELPEFFVEYTKDK